MLGPNVMLGTIKLDTLKAHFISDGKTRKVPALMEHALTYKQEASEMGINDVKDLAPVTPVSATPTPVKKSHKKKV